MGIRKTSLVIDEEVLAAAQRILETATVRETVDQALREVLRAEARREEVRALTEMHGSDLADPQIMAGAWTH